MRLLQRAFAILVVLSAASLAAAQTSPAGAQATPEQKVKASRRDIISMGGFSDGLISACLSEYPRRGCRWHYLDADGRSMLRTNQVWAGERGNAVNLDPPPPFNEGLAATNDGKGKLAYMDKTGALVIRTDFPAIPFSSVNFYFKFEGDLALVCGEFLPANSDGRMDMCSKWGYVNRAGKVVIPPELTFPLEFVEGLTVVQRNGKYGYINNWGHEVIAAKFDHANQFSEEVAGAGLGKKGVLIDKAGEVICTLPPGNEIAYEIQFSEGLSPVFVGKKRGFMDKKCRIVIAGKFDAVGKFSEGLAAVVDGEQWGYIDKTGKTVIAPQFSFALPFEKGIAMVNVGDEGRFIDKTGRFVSETGQPLAPPASSSTPATATAPATPAPAAAAPVSGPAPAASASNSNPGLADQHYQKGIAAWSRFDFATAVAPFEEAVRLQPENTEYRSKLGYVLAKTGQHAAAVPHLQKAVELQPNDAWKHMNLSESLAETGQKESALQEAEKAVSLWPDNNFIREARNRVFAKLGVAANAEGAAKPPAPSTPAASGSAPATGTPAGTNTGADPAAEHFQKGKAAWNQYKYAAALPSFQEAARLAPGNAEYQHQLGFALHVMGRAAEGTRYLQKATELEPKSWEYLMHLADALTDAGQPDAALKAVDKALAIVPGNAYVLGARKRALARAGKTQ